MNARIIRLKKEARALLGPWLAVVIAAAVPAFLPEDAPGILEALPFMGFFFGIPLLATLPLGNEFQYRTLPLWLSQPAGRMQLWGEKLIVSFVAVALAAVAFWLGAFSFFRHQPDSKLAMAAIVWVTVTAVTATFWTLVARSTLGGLVLNTTIFESAVFVLFGPEMDLSEMPASTVNVASAFAIGYAGLMLWLGARKLARFQATGGSAGDDLLMTGPSVMPGALAGLFRCRPSGAIRNLIRKELRLLRPLWLITLLVLVYLAFLAMFGLLPELNEQKRVPITFARLLQFLPIVLFPPLMAILAGTLSLGEERTLGTHAWQMTLPVSARRQWLIKLSMAVLAGLACAVLVPLLVLTARGSIFGSPSMFVRFPSLQIGLLVIALLSFASFWCACATNGTIRAALWVFPVAIAIYFASTGGMWLGEQLARSTGTLMDLVVSRFHLNPLTLINRLNVPDVSVPRAMPFTGTTLMLINRLNAPGLLLLFVPAVVFGVIQSYRLFRTQPQDSMLGVLRCLLPLVLLSILGGLSLSAGFVASRWEPFVETREVLAKLQPGAAQIELTGEDLAQGAALTGLTRRWLRGSRITVTPDKAHSSGYLATIHLASGLECRLPFAQYGNVLFSPERSSCVYKGP